MRRIVCAAVLSVASLSAQSQGSPAATAKFDVVSLKERDLKVPGRGMEASRGRLINRCATLNSLLFFAYGLTRSSPIERLPGWADAACNDVSSADTYEFQATMPPETTNAQARQMMQTFLADRFKLAIHRETKQRPVYALVVSASGFKLKPSDPKDDPPRAPGSIGCPPEDRICHLIVMGSAPVSQLVGALGGNIGRPVIDKTGLTGTYYFDLKWAGDASPDSPLPSLPALLKENFGLELKSETGPVDILVIDHAEKPSQN